MLTGEAVVQDTRHALPLQYWELEESERTNEWIEVAETGFCSFCQRECFWIRSFSEEQEWKKKIIGSRVKENFTEILAMAGTTQLLMACDCVREPIWTHKINIYYSFNCFLTQVKNTENLKTTLSLKKLRSNVTGEELINNTIIPGSKQWHVAPNQSQPLTVSVTLHHRPISSNTAKTQVPEKTKTLLPKMERTLPNREVRVPCNAMNLSFAYVEREKACNQVNSRPKFFFSFPIHTTTMWYLIYEK